MSKVKICPNAWRAFSGLKSAICIFQQNLSKIMGFLINKKNSDGSEIENWPKSANFWPNLYAFCKLRHRWCLLNDNLSPWTKWLVWHVVILGIMSFGHFIALGILSYLGQNVNLTLSILSYLGILSHNKILWFNYLWMLFKIDFLPNYTRLFENPLFSMLLK